MDMYIHICVYIYIYTYVCNITYTYVYTYTYTHVSTSVCMCVSVYTWKCIHVYIYSFVYMCMYICKYMLLDNIYALNCIFYRAQVRQRRNALDSWCALRFMIRIYLIYISKYVCTYIYTGLNFVKGETCWTRDSVSGVLYICFWYVYQCKYVFTWIQHI